MSPTKQDTEIPELLSVLEKCGVTMTETAKKSFDASHIEQDLMRLLGQKKYLNIVCKFPPLFLYFLFTIFSRTGSNVCDAINCSPYSWSLPWK